MNKTLILLCLTAIYSFLFSQEMDFGKASPGSEWRIDCEVPAWREPKTMKTDEEYNSNFATKIDSGTVITVTDYKMAWRKAKIPIENKNGDKAFIAAWILYDTVKKAYRLKKGIYDN